MPITTTADTSQKPKGKGHREDGGFNWGTTTIDAGMGTACYTTTMNLMNLTN